MKKNATFLCILLISCIYLQATHYTFHFTDPEYKNKKQRIIIENFLCSMIPDLINYNNIDKKKALAPVIEDREALLASTSIDKWYENRVSWKLSGNFSAGDLDTVKTFFKKLNSSVGYKQFVHEQKAEVANIVIHFNSEDEKFLYYSTSGESSLPGSLWVVKLKYVKGRVKWDRIPTRFRGDFKEYSSIRYSKKELKFAQSERVVKIVIGSSKRIPFNSPGRKRTIIHELLHGTGFQGHSPYYKCALFPTGFVSKKHDEKLTTSLMKSLYRPDILPGMTLSEAKEVLSSPFNSKPEEFLNFLKEKKNSLTRENKELVENALPYLKKEFRELIKLGKLENRENYFYDELREVHEDQKISPLLINIIASSENLRKKLGLTMAERLKVERKIEAAKTRGDRKAVILLKDRLLVLKDLPRAIVNTHSMRVRIEKLRSEGTPIFNIEKKLQNNLIQLDYINNLLTHQPGL